MNPDESVQALYLRALELRDSGHLLRALQLLEQVVARAPHAMHWATLGQVRYDLDDVDGARMALAESVRLDDQIAPVHGFMALMHLGLNELGRAERSARRSLELADSTHVAALLGTILNRLGRSDEAASMYEEAIRIDGTNEEAFLHLALLHEESDPARCIELLRKARELGSDLAVREFERIWNSRA